MRQSDLLNAIAAGMQGRTQRVEVGPITITEKRAPTDDSVRLLGEMEQAALKRVLRSVPLEGNGIQGVVHEMFDPMGCSYLYHIQYELNGVRRDVPVRVRVTTELCIMSHEDRRVYIKGQLTKALSEDVALCFLSEALRGMVL